ncbi:MAG TPA: copper homeostasis periplasmic binding protein CopC [Telluria sp.]
MRRIPLLAIAAMAIATALSSSAHAHARLEASTPKAGTVVAARPTEIRLQFNEQVELAFSKIRLVDQAGNVVATSSVGLDKSNPKVMIATLSPVGAGSYRVQWSALTRDGHKVKGEFPFRVR